MVGLGCVVVMWRVELCSCCVGADDSDKLLSFRKMFSRETIYSNIYTLIPNVWVLYIINTEKIHSYIRCGSFRVVQLAKALTRICVPNEMIAKLGSQVLVSGYSMLITYLAK